LMRLVRIFSQFVVCCNNFVGSNLKKRRHIPNWCIDRQYQNDSLARRPEAHPSGLCLGDREKMIISPGVACLNRSQFRQFVSTT
jgi:hypothetical protein